MNKDHFIKFRCTKELKEQTKAKAKKQNLSMSKYIISKLEDNLKGGEVFKIKEK